MHEGYGNKQAARAFAVEDLDYDLPDSLIAQYPADRRDDARMLVLDRSDGRSSDSCISDLPELLHPGDLLVLNDTRVLPAKFLARRRTGGVVPGLFVREEQPGRWRVLLQGSKKLKKDELLSVERQAGHVLTWRLAETYGEGQWLVTMDTTECAEEILSDIGETPLPPYIRRGCGARSKDVADRSRYQTVYARVPGAIAAPTAGLHFTKALLKRIRSLGVDTAFVTLHVGIGTFKPIGTHRLADHNMHDEWFELGEDAVDAIEACRSRGGRIVAVGTTTVRVLESVAANFATGKDHSRLRPQTGITHAFLYPPYRFRVVNGLLTNFHLPRSTLLALVMAFAGIDKTRQAYQHAVAQRYRFYSYGDAMLIV